MIHIFGSSGFIGTKMQAFFRKEGKKFVCYSDTTENDCIKFNLMSFCTTDLNINKGDFVILLAAISSPDICQNQYDLAYRVNVEGTSKLIDYCLNRCANVLFFSSDAVNGSTIQGPNNEFSTVKPVGNYAKMKYEVEQKFKNRKHFKAFRLSYVLSDEDKFSKYLQSCSNGNKEAEVFDGLFRNVIKLEIVLEATLCLLNDFDFNDYYLVNLSGNQCLSRKDLALVYIRDIDPSLKYRLIPVPDDILKGRPNVIKTESLFLEKLLKHRIDNIY